MDARVRDALENGWMRQAWMVSIRADGICQNGPNSTLIAYQTGTQEYKIF